MSQDEKKELEPIPRPATLTLGDKTFPVMVDGIEHMTNATVPKYRRFKLGVIYFCNAGEEMAFLEALQETAPRLNLEES